MATLGNTTAGGSSEYTAAPIWCVFTASENGTVTSVSAYVSTAANDNVRFAIYDDASGPNNKLAETASEDPVNTPDSGTWHTLSLSLAITSGTAYWLGLWASNTGGNQRYFYDAGSTNQKATQFGQTYPTWPNPAGGTLADRNVSIYATYTPSASGGGPLIGGGELIKGSLMRGGRLLSMPYQRQGDLWLPDRMVA